MNPYGESLSWRGSLAQWLYVRHHWIMDRDATIITLALCRYRVGHGRWPDSLDNAIAESEPKPIRTEYFDAPFVYRIVDGYPLLYALGDDFEDNGGRPRSYPIYLPDGTRRSDFILLIPPGYLESFDTIEQSRSRGLALIARTKRAAEGPDASPHALNEYAMLLLTCEPEDLRDPQAALPVAKRAVEMSDGEDAAILDTLALAYFMTGDTAKAVETQEKALSLLPPEESPLRTNLEANLAKYRAALSEQESAEPTEPEAKVPP